MNRKEIIRKTKAASNALERAMEHLYEIRLAYGDTGHQKEARNIEAVLEAIFYIQESINKIKEEM
jgi:hypothetical protein